MARKYRDHDEDDADADAAGGVPAAVAGRNGTRQRAAYGEREPDHRGRVLAENDDEVRVFGGREVAEERQLLPAAVDLADVGHRRATLEDKSRRAGSRGRAESARPARAASACGSPRTIENMPPSEEEQSDQKRPEIRFAPVAERVLSRRRFGASPHADEQQNLVGAVGGRVDRFGQKRARAGDHRSEPLATAMATLTSNDWTMCEVFSLAIFQVTLRTSSTVVIAAHAFSMPTWRSWGSCAGAISSRKSCGLALVLMRSRISSVISTNLENPGSAAVARSAALHAPFGIDPRAGGEQELIVGDEILLELVATPRTRGT